MRGQSVIVRCMVTAKTQYNLANAREYLKNISASGITTMKASVLLANGLVSARNVSFGRQSPRG